MKTVDVECHYLSQNNSFTRTSLNDIMKSNVEISHEVDLYLMLLEYNIFPSVNVHKGSLIYIVNEFVSLRTYLTNTLKFNTTLLFNELISFVNTFKSFKFVHGSLNVDNIFLKYTNMYRFCVIDYSHSYLIKEEWQKQLNIDITSLYMSLINTLKKPKHIVRLNKVVKSYF